MERGLDYHVGAGQSQRGGTTTISIARALARFTFVILDEATANVDSATEKPLMMHSRRSSNRQ